MRRLNLTIALGAAAALVGALMVINYGRAVDEKIAEGKETVEVLVATGEIDAGTTAASLADLVTLKPIPREYVATGAIADLAEVQGLTTEGPIAEGAQLTEAQFSVAGQLASVVPEPGLVAIAVQVELPQGVARYIAPGSFVDVFVTYEGNQGGGASPEGQGASDPGNASDRTKLFLSGVRVLSVTAAAPPGSEESVPVSAEQVVALLEVTPSQAERVVNAVTLGKLYLALVAEGELHTTTEGVTPEDVVDSNRRSP